ncbi:MAG: amidophosphoribosyltransferase, partial [Thermoanaerobaculia bacterium]|nr:amidophosphoribosyltransferase [Thermoanaerobaculia bacterium]
MCGIFGIEGHDDAANHAYLGLYALQHRGQESTGIVAWDGRRMAVERGMGHVAEVFSADTLGRLRGRRAIGHTRYSTAGSSVLSNAQPIVVRTSMGSIGIVHNGNLTNAATLRKRLEADGSIFQTTSDTEVILHLLARTPRQEIVESLLAALAEIEGAFSLLVVTETCLVAARDPNGFRPLAMAKLGAATCFASESCAFDLLGAHSERELEPGEVVVVRESGVTSHRLPQAPSPKRCAFEHVYFARPDSNVFGDAVGEARRRMGAQLAREAPADADVVVPVPDSGLFAAIGYSRESGLPFELGMTRNHYVGRTFIEPRQSIRNFGVKIKLNPVRSIIRGKRVVLIDDSIVRGTTSRKIVRMMREAGAAEVHLRISSPP